MDTNTDLLQYIFNQISKKVSSTVEGHTSLRKNLTPEDLKESLDFKIPYQSISDNEILNIIKTLMDQSVNTNHPYFMNQMFGKTQPIAYLADVLITLLNTSMYTYEVAPVLTLIENETIDFLSKKVWGRSGDGVFTSGGSMSNMKAMFLAREYKFKDSRTLGLNAYPPVTIFVSDQAHYSFVKGANFLGFGTDALIKIPSDVNAKIRIDALEDIIEKTIADGRIPIMLTGIAGTTTSGSFDDLEALASIAKKYNMWYHVDACFGGASLFSDLEKHRLKGIEHANSVSWNFHKVMSMPLSTASFLTRDKGLLKEAFTVNADYLFHDHDNTYDLGQKSLQGGRRPEVLKLWLSLKYKGEAGFKAHVESLRQKAVYFSSVIENNPHMELFQTPESVIVCFRYKADSLDDKDTDDLNIKIREEIFKKGDIIFNYAYLNNKVYLRVVLLDPDFTKAQLDHILETIETCAKSILMVADS